MFLHTPIVECGNGQPEGLAKVKQTRYPGKPSADALEAALIAPWQRLAFPPALEHRYQEDHRAQRTRELRRITLIGIVLFLAFLPSDADLIPDTFRLAVILRVAFSIGALGALIVFFRDTVPVWLRELVLPIFTVLCVSILVVLFLMTNAPDKVSYLSGLVVVILYGNLCTSSPFRYVLFCSIVCLIIIVTGVMLGGMPRPVANSYILVSASSVGLTLITLYRLERQQRMGYLRRCLDVFKNEVESKRALDEVSQVMRRQVSANRVATLNSLSDAFEARMQHSVETVTALASAICLQAVQASQIATIAERESSAAATFAGSALTASQTVASAAKELVAGSFIVQRQSSEAADMTADVVNRVRQSASALAVLNDNAHEIDTVVGLISAIAKQSQLLALNATIEAARAGEAGAGFSVVANEVKRLATQTSAATQDVARKVSSMQAAVAEMARVSVSVQHSVTLAHGLTLEIAKAMGRQSEATAAIAKTAAAVAEDASDTSLRTSDAAGHAGNTAVMAHTMRQDGEELERDAQLLRNEADGFMVQLRAI